MADAKSDYLERKDLDHNLGTATFTKPTAVYAALLTATEDDTGAATEVTGGSYARKVITFAAAATSSGVSTAANTVDLVWTGLPTATLVSVGIFDASTAGNLLYYAALTASKSVTSGDGYTISAGQLVVTEQ